MATRNHSGYTPSIARLSVRPIVQTISASLALHADIALSSLEFLAGGPRQGDQADLSIVLIPPAAVISSPLDAVSTLTGSDCELSTRDSLLTVSSDFSTYGTSEHLTEPR